jgi:two-component system NarL family response regulator
MRGVTTRSEGDTSKIIAENLLVFVNTIDVYRSNTMKKLDLHNVAALTRYLVRNVLINI